ncbi:hypothetical protein AVEN_207466-1 [Araneus ventricosus]|uniref:Uncharacterized protein n=1 Tax=Araneus ventricosus TaxID=182803 RepID=A0A4Y2EDA8_ARAVE|nr:hypothetical protein AVEN_207466-1 [Araneus ventricosus]
MAVGEVSFHTPRRSNKEDKRKKQVILPLCRRANQDMARTSDSYKSFYRLPEWELRWRPKSNQPSTISWPGLSPSLKRHPNSICSPSRREILDET